MSKMTIFQLGVFFFALCLTTQVFSQTTVNSTLSTNATTTTTTMATKPFSNTTSPGGAGVSLQASSAALLTPLFIVLHRFC